MDYLQVCVSRNGVKSSLYGHGSSTEFIEGRVAPITFELTGGTQNELAENSVGIDLRVRLQGPFDSYPAQVCLFVIGP